MADTQAPPAPAPPTMYVPVPAAAPAVTAGWAVPAGQAPAKEPAERKRRGRGIPAAPALAAAGNATALSVTAAYSAAGWPGMAAAAGGAAVVAGGAVVRRRRAVKRNSDIRKALRAAGLGGGALGSGGGRGSGLFGGGSAGSGKSAAAGSPRGASGSRSGGGSTVPSHGGRRGGSASPGSSRSGAAGSPSRLGRALDRMLGGSGKKDSADKANRKSASETAAAAKTVKAARKAAKAAAKQARKDLGLPSRSSRLASASRRAAGRAWSRTSSPRAAARRLAAKAARKTRGLTADGLRSLRAGVWGLIRHWSWKKGAGRALAAWKTHRAKRNTVAPTAPAAPTISSTVRRPASSTPIAPTGGRMPGHHFVAPAMEMARAAANYQPTGMIQVISDFGGLSEALGLVAEAMKVTVENADATYPLDPNVIEAMKQVYQLQSKTAALAQELMPAARKVHDADLQRHENPRKGRQGERMWDIASN